MNNDLIEYGVLVAFGLCGIGTLLGGGLIVYGGVQLLAIYVGELVAGVYAPIEIVRIGLGVVFASIVAAIVVLVVVFAIEGSANPAEIEDGELS